LYLNQLDIDSKEAFDRLAIIRTKDKEYIFIDEMCKITFVVKTRKKYGYHIYWLSHKQLKPIATNNCKLNHEFEIKTDNSLGHSTLPPSRHRDDLNFHYQSIGQDTIAILDDLYGGLLKVLADCLKNKENEEEQQQDTEKENNFTIYNNSNRIVLTDIDIEEIIYKIKDYYQRYSRDNIIFGLSGYLFKSNIAIESAEKLILALCKITNDEELNSRITVLHDRYARGPKGEKIAGQTHLLATLSRTTDERTATTIIESISQVWKKYRQPILTQLDDHIVNELKGHVFEITCYNPIRFVIAHLHHKQIIYGEIHEANETAAKIKQQYAIQNISYKDIIINAIPRTITRCENPAVASIELKYEIEFETPTGQIFKTESKTINEILTELQARGLIYKIRFAEEALSAILNAYCRENKVSIKRELETPGFYLIDSKIVACRNENKQPSNEEIVKCANTLNELLTKYKRKEIISTLVKWGIFSPFSFVLKHLQEGEERWMPWLYLYGWTNTGKTTSGRIVLSIWRKQKDKRKHDIGFSNADNVARFGRAVSYDTYPVLINEVQLNDDRQKQLIDSLKHAVQSQTARARLSNRSTSEYISALSPCILTSNSPPPVDPAFQRRIIPIYFSKDDEPTAEQREEFNTFLNDNIDSFSTLGDFTQNYLLNNQDIIHNNDWEDIAKIVLTELFKSAQKEVPEWINYFVQETQVQDIAAEQEQIIRSFLAKTINETYSKHYRNLTALEQLKEDQTLNNNKFEDRLIFCCDKELIPFLRKKDRNILIMQNIVKEMTDQRINNIVTLAELARMLQCEVKPTKVGDKTYRLIVIPIQKLMNFVLPKI
jgi:hypothetical protein